MFAIKLDIVWFLIILHVFYCERRIQNGTEVKSEKPYVVYLVKAVHLSKVEYENWLCGGALVTSEYAVTSAACIKDVDYLYVVAGYKKYVHERDIDTDPCTSKMKKKVVFTCYPEDYVLNYSRTDQWAFIDIGVVKVETPYDFADTSYKTLCSYIPAVIPISFEANNHEAGLDAIVLGWGHKHDWRKETDSSDYNQATLNYAPVMIMNKEECKVEYQEIGEMAAVIDDYMICTLEPGNMDETGYQIESQLELVPYEGCSKRKSLAYHPEQEEEEECEEKETYQYGARRGTINSKQPSNYSTIDFRNKTILNNKRAATNRTAPFNTTADMVNRTALSNRTISIPNKTGDINKNFRSSRRNGICQNDHGGPLVTWVATHEVLIGIASVFKVLEDYKCTGPYLYTSTQCAGAFLDCILSQNIYEEIGGRRGGAITRRSFCKKTPLEKGYATVERHISWSHQQAEPAAPQMNLSHRKSDIETKEQATRTNEENVILNDKNNTNPGNNTKPGKNTNPANNTKLAYNRYPQSNKKSISVNDAINKLYVASKNKTG